MQPEVIGWESLYGVMLDQHFECHITGNICRGLQCQLDLLVVDRHVLSLMLECSEYLERTDPFNNLTSVLNCMHLNFLVRKKEEFMHWLALICLENLHAVLTTARSISHCREVM